MAISNWQKPLYRKGREGRKGKTILLYGPLFGERRTNFVESQQSQ
jgi:hypothetical protein